MKTLNVMLWLFAAFVALATTAWAADLAPAWPQANGPFGNFNPRKYGAVLIDDLAHARQAWISESNDLGFCKGSASGYVGHLADPATHPGTGSSLIVAEGKVFASSARPTGTAWPENHPSIGPAMKDPKYAGASGEALQRNSAADADDVTVAIDLATGKTVWKAVEKGRGVNRYSGKRNHFMVSPAYHDGKIFSFGTTGVLYAYEAASGRKLWEDATGPLAVKMPALKEKLLRERKEMIGGGSMGASLVVADGVLVVPQYDTNAQRDIGLRGVDVGTGKTLWTVPLATCRYATPAVWSHAGRQYIVCATTGQPGKYDTGELRLIDPRDGRVCWTIGGLAPTYYPLSPSEKHVLVNVPSKVANPSAKDGQLWGLLGAYRLSPEKGELAWTMPDQPQFWFENQFDIAAMRRAQIRDGRVYYITQGRTLKPPETAFFFSILNEETGQPLYVSPEGEFGHHPSLGIIGQYWLIEDRILNIRDAAHSDRSTLEWLSIDPQSVRRLCSPWSLPHENTTAYEVFIELPYVEGCFLMRDKQGHVICYDLKRAASK